MSLLVLLYPFVGGEPAPEPVALSLPIGGTVRLVFPWGVETTNIRGGSVDGSCRFGAGVVDESCRSDGVVGRVD